MATRRCHFTRKPWLSAARLADRSCWHTIGHLGNIHLDAGRLELAEPCYDEALALYRENEQTVPLDLANAIRPLAILQKRNGDRELAKSLWKEAQELYAAVDVPAAVAESSRLLAALG